METDNKEIERREFLSKVFWAIIAGMSASLGIIGGGYFISPAFKKEEERWIPVATINDIDDTKPTKVEYVQRKKDGWTTIEGRASCWVLKNSDGSITVFNPRCTHLGCPYRWNDEKKVFLCPCHNAVFSKTGNVVSGPPPRPLDRYPARIEKGVIYIIPRSKKV